RPAVSARCFIVCGALLLLFTNGANGARYQRTQDGKALVWNNLRGVAEQATWSGLRDLDGYATGEGRLTWYRLGNFVNSYTGKMVRGKFEGPVIREQGQTRLQATFVNGDKVGDWSEPGSTCTLASTPQKQSTETAEMQPTEEPAVERPSPSRSPTPSPVSASVASLANRARDFRTKLGYEIAFHESKIETETVDALTIVDQVARSIAEENVPAARMTLLNFLKRYREPPGDNQKPLWRYLTSAL